MPEVLVAVETEGGRIRPRVTLVKSLASALCVGSGGSVGKEGPIMQIGSSIGSALGQALRLGEEHVRLLVASGTAGGIAATFNAPIAGVFFALEVVLRRFSTRNFSVVVLSAVVATMVAAAFYGNAPAIPIPEYRLESAVEIPLYALLGALCAGVAVIFIRVLYWCEDHFEALRFPPKLALPAAGGLLVGAIGLIDAGALGLGDAPVDDALFGNAALDAMALLLVLKIAATSITIGSGGSGGVFRPALFMGAMLGGAFGAIVHDLLPGLTATSGAYATVGMAAMFAGAAHAPITAVLILFEMTRDYAIMLPLMTAVAASTAVSQLLSPGSVYTTRLQHLGLHDDDEPLDVMASLRVSDALDPRMRVFGPGASAGEIARAFEGDPDPVALVADEGGAPLGLVSGFDVSRALAGGGADLAAREFCSAGLHFIGDDQTLREALHVFSARGARALAVAHPDTPGRPHGLLRRADVTRAYAEAMAQRAARDRRLRLRPVWSSADVRYLELRVERGSGLGGRRIAEAGLTGDAVIVAVRHAGETLIPRGDTLLREGDHVTVIAAAGAVAEVRALFGSA